MEDNSPRIEWLGRNGTACLKFTFRGRLDEQGARGAIVEWRRAFEAVPHGKITLIWDCREMDGYASAARSLWQEALEELKPRIDRVWLISESSMIRRGASVISLFSSFPITPVRDESEIECPAPS